MHVQWSQTNVEYAAPPCSLSSAGRCFLSPYWPMKDPSSLNLPSSPSAYSLRLSVSLLPGSLSRRLPCEPRGSSPSGLSLSSATKHFSTINQIIWQILSYGDINSILEWIQQIWMHFHYFLVNKGDSNLLGIVNGPKVGQCQIWLHGDLHKERDPEDVPLKHLWIYSKMTPDLHWVRLSPACKIEVFGEPSSMPDSMSRWIDWLTMK